MASPNLPLVSLMYPTLIAGPFHREGWVYEEQYDGCRMVAYKDGTAVRLINQAGQDQAQRFPELVAALGALPARTLILDGEVCIFDPQLISRFEWLWRRPTGETDARGLRLPLRAPEGSAGAGLAGAAAGPRGRGRGSPPRAAGPAAGRRGPHGVGGGTRARL